MRCTSPKPQPHRHPSPPPRAEIHFQPSESSYQVAKIRSPPPNAAVAAEGSLVNMKLLNAATPLRLPEDASKYRAWVNGLSGWMDPWDNTAEVQQLIMSMMRCRGKKQEELKSLKTKFPQTMRILASKILHTENLTHPVLGASFNAYSQECQRDHKLK